MNSNNFKSRRSFLGLLATGAVTTGLTLVPKSIRATSNSAAAAGLMLDVQGEDAGALDNAVKAIGKKQHPVGYDVSQANHWGVIWSNVYYMTNAQTGTPEAQLGVLNVLRHHGMLFAMSDETIAKYKLGEFFGFDDPVSGEPTLRNPMYTPGEGDLPPLGLVGIKDLQAKGTLFCVCDMARQVNAMMVAKKLGLAKEDVYADFVKGTLPGIMPAPSGVWVLGRLAENGIAYIDASVG
jgi:hypothetical protein